jgi:hypothetical protein
MGIGVGVLLVKTLLVTGNIKIQDLNVSIAARSALVYR